MGAGPGAYTQKHRVFHVTGQVGLIRLCATIVMYVMNHTNTALTTVLLRMFGDFHQWCLSPICITIGLGKGVITKSSKR
jgi:hypothetical protein